MTRKLDGWMHYYRGTDAPVIYIKGSSFSREYTIYSEKPKIPFTDGEVELKPVCLCDPRLLDWVEKMREGLALQSSGWAKSLSDELNAILPEDTCLDCSYLDFKKGIKYKQCPKCAEEEKQ